MDLSVIILTWNSERYVESCLRSVLATLAGTGLDFEILVVDNGSGDRTAELLRQMSGESGNRIVVHYLPENLGTTVPRNLALRRARGSAICIMDSDVEVGAGVFTGLLRCLEGDPSLGLVVPQVCYPSGRLQKSCDQFPTLVRKIERFFRLRALEQREAQDRSAQEVTVDYAISAFWLFRRELLDTVGLLDEKIFYAPEDVDFCLRVWKSGYRIVYRPCVSVVHHTQEISRGFGLNRAKLHHLKGLLYYFVKHRYFLSRPRFATPGLRPETMKAKVQT